MNCAGCQAGIPGDARYCPFCGAPVDPVRGGDQDTRKIVTVLFCDMTDSTALSERLDPESLRALMLRYFELMREPIEHYGGTVEKYIGDAVMAVFGVPVVHEDDPRRAIRAAIDMREALIGFNEELTRLLGVRIGIRVGINTGEVVTPRAPAGRDQVLASGEAVNIAARLEQHAAPGEILLGPDTFRGSGAGLIAEPVGPLPLKGRSQPLPAYRLVDLDVNAPTLPRRVDGPFVGRDPHLNDLLRSLERAGRDRCAVLVSLFGDAGVGKSRLAQVFAAEAAGRGAVVGAGRCRQYGGGGTLLALADALHGVLDRPPTEECGGPEPEDLAELRCGLLSDGTPGASIEETSWAVCRLLDAMGRDRTVVLVLDDLQWAGQSLLDTLDHVADWTTAGAVLLLCVARPDLLERRPAWGSGKLNAISMTLPPLAADESRLLVDALSEVTPHATDTLERIVTLAEGNPLFLEQLVAMLHDGGSGDALPPTIQALVTARLDALGRVDREVLEFAATAAMQGREFTREALAALWDGEPAELSDALRVLTHRRLIRPWTRGARGEGYRFAGTLIQQVAYAGMPKRARARCHERLAHRLEGGPGGDRTDPDLMAAHLERAFRLLADLGPLDGHARLLRERAAVAMGAAGSVALRHGDLQRAVELLERALALHAQDDPGRLRVALSLVDARLAVGGVDTGRDLLRQVLAQAEQSGDQAAAAHCRLQLAYLDTSLPGFESIAAVARETLPVFEAAGDPLGQARGWLRIGQAQQVRGRFGDAVEPLGQALAHANRADAELERATVLGALAVSLWLGPVPAQDGIGQCRDLLGRYGEGRRAVQATLSCPLAVLLAGRREFDEARALIATAQSVIDRLGHAFAAASVLVFGAAVDALAGRLEPAEEALRRASRASIELGDVQTYVAASGDLARLMLARGRTEEALELVRAAEARHSDVMPMTLADLAGIRARVYASRGRSDRAQRLIRTALRNARLTDSITCRGTALLDKALVLADLDDPDGARSAATAAHRHFARKGHLVGQGWAEAVPGGAGGVR
ncbi:adenylate/guanylate cyclase domain-containing protein [Spongiactinospora sp. TRM90649]|uniref:adenylate/guanylate cyclase domain-containing protein n=1 Tax=Spongiactinospora sp. TRM90649 TaxID=3031114 RepID=UPI0023F66BD2|nr:adenylate/guanylate cyclase domain-containing protein [Spongiactinospora sp. TRM90649]MDF5759104.1 adenylate/guanylate cyclase domain-containing protein [Spongiactinospora sp. TRM90649]